ncbi:MAG: hypothetical protein ACXVPC_12225, partial [Tumebacillaceae bacterium]
SAIGTLGKNPVTGTEDLPALVDFVKNYQGPIAYQADGRIQYANTITATNNAGATDSVFVDKLNANDKVRVYASATATTPLATATVATGQTSVTVNNLDLGANAGTVYVMIVSNGQSTGPMLPITFAAE